MVNKPQMRIVGTPIVIDHFSKKLCYSKLALCFLTHAHSEHYQGLSAKWKHRIYCSEVTAKILAYFFNFERDVLHPLQLNETHPLTWGSDPESECATVTAIDAEHCPGSVMYLFEGHFGRVVCTGDFRLEDCSVVPERWWSSPVDKMYFDDYAYDWEESVSKESLHWPSRDKAREEALNILRGHLPDKVFLVMPQQKLGKEELLIAIAQTFGVHILAPKERVDIAKLIGLPDVFTNDPVAARMELISLRSIKAALRSAAAANGSVIILLLTTVVRKRPFLQELLSAPFVFWIPYCDHCNPTELDNFINLFHAKHKIPRRLGTITAGSDRRHAKEVHEEMPKRKLASPNRLDCSSSSVPNGLVTPATSHEDVDQVSTLPANLVTCTAVASSSTCTPANVVIESAVENVTDAVPVLFNDRDMRCLWYICEHGISHP
ncbi:unnamed protein product [Soboliphyme baturini]|uniref:Lactamase_B domain-containing protein n=1 Tax=Soboliphyme baturini TaxID=241478 RepID=A0A183J523_9BILA|nr:unnamed protein product [Soboliphyme baturini]